MKSSFNFNLEIHNSHSVTAHQRNKRRIWFLLILLLVLAPAIYFAGYKILKSPATTKLEQSVTAKQQLIKTISLSNIENLKTGQSQN